MPTDTPSTASMLPAIQATWARELLRFMRARGRLVGALAMPLLFWLMLGAGFGESFKGASGFAGDHYLEFFLPGIVMMTVLFASVSATITVIDDRHAGFLQGVLVSPASRAAIVIGKTLGATTVGMIQGVILLVFGLIFGVHFPIGGVLMGVLVLFLSGFALTALGLILAWVMDSTAGFHAVMNVLFIPMWMLSGAIFPLASAHSFLRFLMLINPLTYGMGLLRIALGEGTVEQGAAPANAWVCLAVTIAFGAVAVIFATRLAARRT